MTVKVLFFEDFKALNFKYLQALQGPYKPCFNQTCKQLFDDR